MTREPPPGRAPPATVGDADSADSRALHRLCVACVKLLGVSGAGVSLMTAEGSSGTVAASSALAAQIEEWQFTLGEGPCRQAYADNRPVLVGDLTDAAHQVGQWPVFAAVVQQAGIRGVFAFPLRRGPRPIGVLDLCRDRPGLLNADQVAVAIALADLAGTLLHPDVPEADVDGKPVYRVEVHQATGMLAAQLGTSTKDASACLRARAFAEERTASELATDVVSRRIRFDEEDL